MPSIMGAKKTTANQGQFPCGELLGPPFLLRIVLANTTRSGPPFFSRIVVQLSEAMGTAADAAHAQGGEDDKSR